MYREWNVFGRLRQALVHIQTTNALGRRPRPYSSYSQPFRPGREIEASYELVCTIYKSSLQQLEHSAQGNANLKHGVSPGAYHCSVPRTNGRFRANTSGDDCTPHRAGEYTKSSGSLGLSTANTFIPCGFAISSCGLTSISAIAATAFDKSYKWPK